MQMHMLHENYQSIQEHPALFLSYPKALFDIQSRIEDLLIKLPQIQPTQAIPRLIQRTPNLRLHAMTATTLIRKSHLRTIARQIKLIHSQDQIFEHDFKVRRLGRRPDSELGRGLEEGAEKDGVAGEAVGFVTGGAAAR